MPYLPSAINSMILSFYWKIQCLFIEHTCYNITVIIYFLCGWNATCNKYSFLRRLTSTTSSINTQIMRSIFSSIKNNKYQNTYHKGTHLPIYSCLKLKWLLSMWNKQLNLDDFCICKIIIKYLYNLKYFILGYTNINVWKFNGLRIAFLAYFENVNNKFFLFFVC